MSTKPINVAIVDDKLPNRSSLSQKIGQYDDFEVSFMAENGVDFLVKMKASHKLPDVVLMDIDMPELDGIGAVSAGFQLYPGVHFVMLTVFDDDAKIFDAIKSGAVGYLLKDEKIEAIAESLRQVMNYGGAPMSPRIARKALQLLSGAKVAVQQKEENVLTDREMEILQGLISGSDYKAIADKLFISPFTVRTHITNIYKKLHVSNKTQAINLATKKGWFS
ncbi:MAG: response regulator transcription factor [Cyclobacteriaceae bacterium]